MVFSSHLFLFYFLPATLALYYLCPPRGRHLLLTLLSYVFYGWANPWFVLLMLFTTAVTYCCGQWISGAWSLPMLGRGAPAGPGLPSKAQRKTALVTAIVVNLGILGVFKYLGFVQTNLNVLLEWFGQTPVRVYQVALPVGISFYTFQALSYCLDLYDGVARRARNPIDFACYVALFPQLVAGPIVRYRDLAEQLQSRSHTIDKFTTGVFFFALGMVKKILLANPMGQVADAAFEAASLPWHGAWTGVTAYAFQIYFDFSGYSDMAIGLGMMLGFQFRRNFDLPYLSRSFAEFWRRWHISLSTLLQAYIFMPVTRRLMKTKLRGKGQVIPCVGYVVTFLLCGLWHGAAWTFVFWGALHAALLVAERLNNRRTLYARLPAWAQTLATFGITLVTWVFFRAESLPEAIRYLGLMFGAGDAPGAASLAAGLLYQPQFLLVFAACALVHVLRLDTWDLARELRPAKLAFAGAGLAASVAVLFTQSYNPFLYFQF